jgi:hypothetical protein
MATSFYFFDGTQAIPPFGMTRRPSTRTSSRTSKSKVSPTLCRRYVPAGPEPHWGSHPRARIPWDFCRWLCLSWRSRLRGQLLRRFRRRILFSAVLWCGRLCRRRLCRACLRQENRMRNPQQKREDDEGSDHDYSPCDLSDQITGPWGRGVSIAEIRDGTKRKERRSPRAFA